MKSRHGTRCPPSTSDARQGPLSEPFEDENDELCADIHAIVSRLDKLDKEKSIPELKEKFREIRTAGSWQVARLGAERHLILHFRSEKDLQDTIKAHGSEMGCWEKYREELYSPAALRPP